MKKPNDKRVVKSENSVERLCDLTGIFLLKIGKFYGIGFKKGKGFHGQIIKREKLTISNLQDLSEDYVYYKNLTKKRK